MNFEIVKHNSYTLIRLTIERLDSNISASLKNELINQSTQGVKNLIMDVASVKYCDSSGLSAILVGNRLCRNNGGKFVLSSPQELVVKLIMISQLDSILKIAKTSEEAQTLIQ